MAAGSIIIDLLARTASFITDMDRARKKTSDFDKTISVLGRRLATALSATAVTVFAKKTVDAADAASKAAQAAGISTEAYTALAYAAKLGGIEQQQLGVAFTKINALAAKNAEELQAVGVATRDAAGNAKTADVLLAELADRFSKMEDGAAKSALAAKLFGEEFGPRLLPLLNAGKGGLADLRKEAEALGLVIDTDTGKRAEAFNDNLSRLGSVASGVANRVMADLLPSLESVTANLFESAKGAGILDSAARAAATGVRLLASVGLIVGAAFKTLGEILGGVAATVLEFFAGNFRRGWAIAKETVSDAKANIAGAASALGDIWNTQAGKMEAAVGRIPPPVIAAGKKVKQEVDKIAKAMADLDRELATFGKDEFEVRLGDFRALGAAGAQVEEYAAKLQRLKDLRTQDAIAETIKALEQERDAFGLSATEVKLKELALAGASQAQLDYARSVLQTTDRMREQAEVMAEGKRITEDMRTPIERLQATYTELNKLLAAGAISQETYSRAVFKAQDDFDKATEETKDKVEKTKSAVEELGMTFASAFEDAIVGGKGLRELVQGLDQDILRIVTRKMVTEPLANAVTGMLGNLGGGAGGGGLLGGLGSFFSGMFGGAKAGGGDVLGDRAYLVGEQGPEMFVPRTAGTILPAAQTAAAAGRSFHQTNHFHVQGPIDRRTQQQLAAEAARQAALANARGN